MEATSTLDVISTPDISEDDVASIPLDTPLSVDVTSTTNTGTIGPGSESTLSSESDTSIDNGPGSILYVITGVIVAIIVLGILTAFVAVVLFMKARYSYIDISLL
jgi:hypothetical protein